MFTPMPLARNWKLAVAGEPRRGGPADGAPDGRDQQENADTVGEEAGRHHEERGDEEKDAVEHFGDRRFAAPHRLFRPPPGLETLHTQQGGTEKGGSEHDGNGCRDADQTTHLDENRDLDDGNGDEYEKEDDTHGVPLLNGRQAA